MGMDVRNIISIDSGGHRERVLARRDALVAGHLDLVRSIASGLRSAVPMCFSFDDLVAAGHVGLMQAAIRYRPADHGGTPFDAYARPVIRGAILDTVRRKQYQESMRAGLDQVPEPSVEPDFVHQIDSARMRQRVAEAMGKLEARERAVLLDYYGPEEPSLAVVARRIGVSTRAASRLHVAAVDRLRELLRTA